jgi:hypothetical protein
MLRLIRDADVHGDIVRCVRGRNPGIDLVRAQEVGRRQTPLSWNGPRQNIALLSHRTATP